MTEKLNNIDLEFIRLGQNILADRWLESVVHQSAVPAINLPLASKLIHKAQLTQQPLVFVGIGCQDWQKLDQQTWHIGKVSPENKRARRFAEEISQFQSSLTSLGIKSRFNLSLSNVELECPLVQSLDSAIDDLEWARNNARISQENLASLIDRAGGQINWFDHWQIFKTHQSSASSYAEFMTNLFNFDLSHTAQIFVGTGQIGPIWLDCQSTSFNEVARLFQTVAADSNLPILAPFKNAGNWHAKPVSQNNFPNATRLMAEFRLKPAAGKSEWVNKNLRMPDPVILAALKALGINDFTIDDDWEKRKQAIEILALIAFNN